MKTAAELQALIQLAPAEQNQFIGQNYQAPWKRLFGGQVLAQSLYAAYQTAPQDRNAHSLHGYFLRVGDIDEPVTYDVEVVRDGGSFSSRSVTAIQHDLPIFKMMASFQLEKDGLEHQVSIPNVPGPEGLKNDAELLEMLKNKAPELYKSLNHPQPLEFRPVEKMNIFKPKNEKPFRHIWFKAKGELSADVRVHQQILAYASDYSLLSTALLPHQGEVNISEIFLASLDHAMWFHRDFRADEWLLYQLDSPSATNSRGFARGNVFDQEGMLVASVTQEGLMSKFK